MSSLTESNQSIPLDLDERLAESAEEIERKRSSTFVEIGENEHSQVLNLDRNETLVVDNESSDEGELGGSKEEEQETAVVTSRPRSSVIKPKRDASDDEKEGETVENPDEPEVFRRKYQEEDSSHPNWPLHKKHIFALSLAGKPIYSRYGDEQNLAPFMGALTAMVSFVQDLNDNLRYLEAGQHRFVFVVKGSIIFVGVSRTDEPISNLVNQLNYVHAQIISILTAGVNGIFDRKPNYDLRSLLGGADRFLDSLSSLMDHDISFLLNSIHCLRLDSSVRSNISSVLQSAQHPDLLYSIMIAGHQLVNLIRPKKYVLQPGDMHLIMNFVHASTAFRTGNESWTPLCLPKFNDSGFLHSYVCFIAKDICLLLLSTKQECFYELSSCKNMIVQGLNKTGALDSILKAYEKPDYSVGELGIPGLLHFLYKSKGTCQFTCPRFEAPYTERKEQKRLFRMYQRAHKKTHGIKNPHKVYYQVSYLETIIAWVTAGFELFAVFGPMESKGNCIKSCNDILKWIKNEEGNLLILNSPVW